MTKNEEETISISKGDLNDLLDSLEEFNRKLEDVHRKQRKLFESILLNGEIKPGALFEVLSTEELLLQENSLKRDKICVYEGETIMFVGLETRTEITMFDWLINDRVVSIHPGNIATNIGLVKNGQNGTE